MHTTITYAISSLLWLSTCKLLSRENLCSINTTWLIITLIHSSLTEAFPLMYQMRDGGTHNRGKSLQPPCTWIRSNEHHHFWPFYTNNLISPSPFTHFVKILVTSDLSDGNAPPILSMLTKPICLKWTILVNNINYKRHH